LDHIKRLVGPMDLPELIEPVFKFLVNFIKNAEQNMLLEFDTDFITATRHFSTFLHTAIEGFEFFLDPVIETLSILLNSSSMEQQLQRLRS
jgi:hypothetical protein